MKGNKITSYLLLFALSYVGVSCADYVEGINEDPNNATDAPIETLITGAQVNLAGIYEGANARLTGMWTRQFTGCDRQYVSLHQYVVATDDFNWVQSYVGVIQQCNIAIEKLEAQSVVNKKNVGMLKIMKAMTFGYHTSFWGDVPFFEANQSPIIGNPVYDNQLTVYSGIQLLLSDAIADLGGAGNISEDILAGKNATTWINAAHTLKARYYLHVGDYVNAAAEASIGLAAGTGLTMAHGTVLGGNQNLWYDFHQNQRSGYLCAADAILPLMLDSSQPQYRGNAKTNETARFAFVYTGNVGTYDLNVTNGMFAQTASYSILTYIENQLILAECHLRKAVPDEAASLGALNSARAALRIQFPTGIYTDYIITDFDNDGLENSTGLTRQQALLGEILQEKYVSLVGQAEVFNDFRRTNNALGLPPVVGTQFPERFILPSNELNANSNAPNPIPSLFTPTVVNQ